LAAISGEFRSTEICRRRPPNGAGTVKPGNGEQLHPHEVEAVGTSRLRNRLLEHHLPRSARWPGVLDDHGRLDARGRMRRMVAVDRVDLGDRGTDVGARMEIDLDQADAGMQLDSMRSMPLTVVE